MFDGDCASDLSGGFGGIGCAAERGGMNLFQKGLGFSTEQEIFVENLPADFSAAWRGQTHRPHPVDETGSCRWLRGRGAACGRNSRGGAGAAVCLLQGRGDTRSKSRVPQPGAALRFLQAPFLARRKNRLSARGTNAGNEPERNGSVELSEIQKLDGTH